MRVHRTKFERAHALEQGISERARLVLCESKGNPRASREIRAQAGRFALAHYINLLSRYQNALSTFGSKMPYQTFSQRSVGVTSEAETMIKVTRQIPERVWLWVLAWELSRMHFSRFSSVNQLWMTFEQSTVLSLALRQFDPHNRLPVCLSACLCAAQQTSCQKVHQLTESLLTVINLYETRVWPTSMCSAVLMLFIHYGKQQTVWVCCFTSEHAAEKTSTLLIY